MDFYFGFKKESSELNASHFNDYVRLIFDLLKDKYNTHIFPGDLLLYKKADAYDYKTVFANEFEISFIKDMMESIRNHKNVVYDEFVNLYSINHLSDIIISNFLEELSEKVNLIDESKRKYYISENFMFKVVPSSLENLEEGEERNLKAEAEKLTKAKCRNRNVLMYELLPRFVADNVKKLKDLPIELVLMYYLKSIKDLGV